MINTIPIPQLVLGYVEFFNEPPPEDRLSIVASICKTNLIAELSGLNYRLKQKTSKHQDTTLDTQAKALRYFSNNDDFTLRNYSRIPEKYTKNKDDYPLIFIRQSCLFALEEIIQSNLEVIEDFNVSRPEVCDAIFKYILAVNTHLTKIEEEENEDKVNFENINPKMLPLNELNVSTDPIYTPYRGYKLLEFLSKHEQLKSHVKDYFAETYSATYDYFIYETLGMYLANKRPNPEHDFYYSVQGKSNTLFEALSKKYNSADFIKLLSIKKFPFYKSSESSYILFDNTLLLEKSYSQFINDFWFDHVKNLKSPDGLSLFDIKKYRSIIGYFFESYVRDTIEYCFAKSKHYKLRLFDDLKIAQKSGEIEIADLYVRYDRKIILGQAKSTSIYDNEKYGGNVEAFYKNNRSSFFESFGVDQLVNSILKLENHIKDVDLGFPVGQRYKIFPVLIVNEKALQAPLMGDIFQNRFLELMQEFKNMKTHIYPLSIIHISDLENIQEFLYEKPNEIWNLLKYHCRYPEFMPPFYNSIYRRDIRPNYKRSVKLYEELILRYQAS
jgi:hypothetical protein